MQTTSSVPVLATAAALYPFSVSVFFPAYNDSPSIGNLVSTAYEILSECLEDFEIIVINDGSKDDTGAVLEELRKEFAPHVKVVTHASNRGYGAALRSGFAAASKDFVFYTDGDGQYDVSELPRLLDQVREGVGLVNGYKTHRQDPLHRIWIGRTYNSFAKLLFRVRLRDIDCDFRLIRRSLMQQLHLTSTSGTICVELVRKIETSGCEVVELPVNHYPRLHGRSQFFRIASLANTFAQLLKLHWQLVVRPSFAGRQRTPQ